MDDKQRGNDTIEPNSSGYILLKGIVWSDSMSTRTNRKNVDGQIYVFSHKRYV